MFFKKSLKFLQKELFLRCAIILGAFFLLIAVPVLLLISTPIFLFRCIVKHSAKKLRPDLDEMVTPRGTIFAVDNLYTSPKCNVVVCATVKGKLELNELKSLLLETINLKNPSGHLRYPELKEYITSWLGFLFWKKDKHFNVQNHVSELKYRELLSTEQDIQQTVKQSIHKTWSKKRPLWDIIFAYKHSLEENEIINTILIIRGHHSIGDGFSLLEIAKPLRPGDLIDSQNFNEIPKLKENRKIKLSLKLVLSDVSKLFKCAYEVSETIISQLVSSKLNNVLKSKAQSSVRFHAGIAENKLISMIKIKKISTHFNVRLSAVLLSVYSGAIRDVLIRNKKIVPKKVTAITILPLEGHPEGLRNHMTGGIVSLPIGESDPVTRIKICSKDYENVKKKSTFHLFTKYFLVICGSYFHWITRHLAQNYFTPCGISNFSGGKKLYWNGWELLDVMFVAGLQSGTTGLGFCSLSYNDGLRIVPVADASVLTEQDVDELYTSIGQQLDVLYNIIESR